MAIFPGTIMWKEGQRAPPKHSVDPSHTAVDSVTLAGYHNNGRVLSTGPCQGSLSVVLELLAKPGILYEYYQTFSPYHSPDVHSSKKKSQKTLRIFSVIFSSNFP